jgi:hypothetical protein
MNCSKPFETNVGPAAMWAQVQEPKKKAALERGLETKKDASS